VKRKIANVRKYLPKGIETALAGNKGAKEKSSGIVTFVGLSDERKAIKRRPVGGVGSNRVRRETEMRKCPQPHPKG